LAFTELRMRSPRILNRAAGRLALALFPLLTAASAGAQGYKIEVLKEAPPSALAAAVRAELLTEGYRVVDDQGKPYAEFWLRKAIPASEKPGAPQGAIQFPFLAEGELLGALRFPGEGRDYRDQAIAKGVYTLRFGLQPVNGDHLGVSTYRDYALLLPAAKDTAVAPLPKKRLEDRSAESAGTSHPAVLILLAAPAPAASSPSMARDEEKNTWGAVFPLSLSVKGTSGTTPQGVQLIVVGVAAA
jgi:hypothetical protein